MATFGCVGILLLAVVPPPQPALLHQLGGVNHGLHSSVAIKGNRMKNSNISKICVRFSRGVLWHIFIQFEPLKSAASLACTLIE